MAGEGIAFRWAVVMRGINAPFVTLETSSMEEPSGLVPEELIPTFCEMEIETINTKPKIKIDFFIYSDSVFFHQKLLHSDIFKNINFYHSMDTTPLPPEPASAPARFSPAPPPPLFTGALLFCILLQSPIAPGPMSVPPPLPPHSE